MTKDIGTLDHPLTNPSTHKVIVDNGQLLDIHAVGNSHLKTSYGPLQMSYVYYIMNLSRKLLSIKQLCKDKQLYCLI